MVIAVHAVLFLIVFNAPMPLLAQFALLDSRVIILVHANLVVVSSSSILRIPPLSSIIRITNILP